MAGMSCIELTAFTFSTFAFFFRTLGTDTGSALTNGAVSTRSIIDWDFSGAGHFDDLS